MYKKFINKLLSIFLFIMIYSSTFALSPKSKINILDDDYNKKCLEEYFLQQNPKVIDLSKFNIYPSKNDDFQSILLINAHKRINVPSLYNLFNHQFDFMKSIDSSDNFEKHRNLYVLLQQIAERFNLKYGQNAINVYLSEKIRSFLNDKGYSCWTLFRKKHFNLEYILLELIKNAIIHGNNLDMTKPVFISWDVTNLGVFTLKIGDFSSAKMLDDSEGLKTIVDDKKDINFYEKLSIVRTTGMVGEKLGIKDLQLMNDKRWTIYINLIKDVEGHDIGKYIVLQTKLEKKQKNEMATFNILNFRIIQTLLAFA